MKQAFKKTRGRLLPTWMPSLVSVSACLLVSLLTPLSAHAAVDAQVTRGAYVAKLGDCVACHTAKNGKPFAGGLSMTTPMGAVYTTNITPDKTTGIGSWSEADFEKALRHGVSKDGHNLYPAMPYPSYAKISDDDIHALYAYMMQGVAPVAQANRPPDIPFPLNMRWPLKLWNVVFLSNGTYQPKTGKDAEWNRGAYLVQSLGHCGACHTARGVAFQEKALDETGTAYLAGAPLDGWFASNLTGADRSGLGRWSAEDLKSFLKTGANAHATAYGSMTDVINHSTQWMSDADLAAISTYLKSLPAVDDGNATPYAYDPKATLALLSRPAGNPGARVYATYCIGCHAATGKGYAPLLAPLAGNPTVLGTDPVSLINVTLHGAQDLVIQGVPTAYGMPAYADVLNDQQIADVLNFVRAGWNNGAGQTQAAQVVQAKDVAKLRTSPSSH